MKIFLLDNIASKISNLIIHGAQNKMSDLQFIEQEINRWKCSPQRAMQLKGHLYYGGDHDILHCQRTVIGEDGKLEAVDNLPNNRIVDNQYAKLVNQKANYLLGQPIAVEGENKNYVELLRKIFNKHFMKQLKNAGKAALNSGISWLYPYYDEDGRLSFRMFPGYEILPFWRDSEHTILDCAVRLYQVVSYEGFSPKIIEKVEIFDLQGVRSYILDNNTLVPDTDRHFAYASADGINLNWAKIPLIPIKYNEQEIPLIKKVKSLQDGINVMLSDFENNMQEDVHNTIIVIKNYDGTDLGEFRRNLATFGAVKVQYDGETKGGVETLEVNVNSENYKAILELFKKALIENGMGYDAKDDRLSGNPNQMNIQSMYSDIDLDANDMETELQAAFEEILWFVNAHLANTGQGDFDGEDVNIIFNRDILINEGEAIANCTASVGILSDETIVAQHPWVDNPQQELERLKKQKQDELKQGYDPFGGDEDEE